MTWRKGARLGLQARQCGTCGGGARVGGTGEDKGGQKVRKRRGREASSAQEYPPQRRGREQHTAFQCFLVKIWGGGGDEGFILFCFFFFFKKA